MAPSRFAKERKREVTPYRDEPGPASMVPLRPTTPGPNRPSSPVDPNVYYSDRPVTPAPPEWTSYDAPMNFTWVIPDELCGMGWPKSRDQVRFLVEQGIDHLVSLSPEKIPPHYAFPDLKHTLIPVEDFTGPTIAEIQKFLEICDCARRDGEAVGVHCAEGRGRTGVMCACYLIYYYDMEPWDAIRIMRRQRPGSVERKVQEETVVRFYQLLLDYGKESIDSLDQRDRQLCEMQRKAQAELIRNEALATQKATANLLNHMHSFHSKQSAEAKQERIERMRRARSMPKLDLEEEEKKNIDLKLHVQSFLQGSNKPKRVKSRRGRDTDTDNDYSDNDRRSRATTPGRALLEEVNLKPPSERTIKNRLDAPKKEDDKSELKNHFRDFMRTPASVKRGRSFSQPRDKDGGKNSGKEESLSRKESFNEKYTREADQNKIELENHAKRFLQRRSLIKPKSDNDSDNDSFSSRSRTRTIDNDSRDLREDSSSDDDLDNSNSSASNTNIVSYKPPIQASISHQVKNSDKKAKNDANNNSNYDNLSEAVADTETITKNDETEVIYQKHQNSARSSERVRSKSAIVPPTNYELELNVEQMLEDSWGPRSNTNNGLGESSSHVGGLSTSSGRRQKSMEANGSSVMGDFKNGQTAEVADWMEKDENSENSLLNNDTFSSDSHRIRKYNVYSNNEYVYLDANMKIGNSKPRPFTLSHHSSSQDYDKKSFSRQNSSEYADNNARGAKDASVRNDSVSLLEKSYSRMFLGEDKENKKQSKSHRFEHRRSESKADEADDATPNNSIASSFTAKTTEILNACKNDIKKLTYRKIYMRSRSDHDRTKSKSVENDHEDSEIQNRDSPSVYTKYSSGSRIPNRPTTPGPYLERAVANPSPYIPKRPTTPGPFTRESWKRTNKKFNYTHLNKYSTHETFV